MNLIGIKARKASEYKVTTEVKNKVLNDYAKLIKNEKKFIINQNSKDINYARKKGLKENLIKRLHLNENKLDGIINSILKIAKLRDPIDNTLDKWKRPNGLNIKRVSIPIGVIGVIYESRPNVTSDVASLCFKSGNVVILKGGSEAINSNKALAKLFRKALKKNKVDFIKLGYVSSKRKFNISFKKTKIELDIDHFRDSWFKSSSLLDLEQTSHNKSDERFKNYKNQPLKFKFPNSFSGKIPTNNHTKNIKAAVIREKGINSEREMAYMLHLAGFEVKDVHMTDLVSGRENLNDIKMLVFPGGFSNSDVLGSAKGWAGAFKFNKNDGT